MQRMAKAGQLAGYSVAAFIVAVPVTAAAQVEEVVVTAQRRAENMQEVPIAISAFDAETISASRVEGFEDLVTRVPTLSINSTTKGSAFPALRGSAVSQPSISGGQSVGLMIDDVAYTTSADWDISLYDIERVEVLRGPQGTLFGRNVVGGLINIVTKMPADEFSGTVEVSTGNYRRFDTKGSVNVPLGSGWTSRLSFFTQEHRGTSFNRVTGNRVDANDKYGFRGLVRYDRDNLDLVLSGEYQRDTSGGTARDYVGPSSALPGLGFDPDNGPRVVDQRVDGDFDMTGWSLAAKATYSAPFADLVTVTAYRERDQLYTTDLLGLPRSSIYFDNDVDMEQFTQEFRIVSSDSGRLRWTAGLFYMNLKLHELNTDYFEFFRGTFLGELQNCFRIGSAASDVCAEIFGVPAGNDAVPPDSAFIAQPIVYSLVNTRLESFSGYAEATLAITDALNLTAGARYTHEKIKGSIAQYGDSAFIIDQGPYSVEVKDTFNAFTPKVTIDYQFSPRHMVYATASKGFKGGAFVLRGTAELSSVPVDPETAWNYEIGAKTEWLDRRLRINLTGFKVDYKDQQTFLFTDDGQVVVENAGKVEVEGIELDVEASPMEQVALWAHYAYSRGKIMGLEGFEGNKPSQLPPHALTYGASISIPVPDLQGEITLRGEGVYKSRHFLEASNQDPYSTKYNHVLDASISYKSDDGRLSLSVWGKNLTDKTIVIYGQHAAGLFYLSGSEPGAELTSSPRYAEPRMYGVSLNVAF